MGGKRKGEMQRKDKLVSPLLQPVAFDIPCYPCHDGWGLEERERDEWLGRAGSGIWALVGGGYAKLAKRLAPERPSAL